jgi:FPC/CPF motif-containing protein YcgG
MSIAPMNATESVKQFIAQPQFPCAGAKTALAKDQITVKKYDDMRCESNNVDLLTDIYEFSERFNIKEHMYSSFVSVFEQPETFSEREFEDALWTKLQQLHDIDCRLNDWDKTVSSDPASTNFSYSLGSKAFFIIGLHPNAARRSRKFHRPAIVFNLHAQFEHLREHGKFEVFRDHIREKDAAFCGDKNASLANHGDESEARQYSGRKVEANWQCPFHKVNNN